MVSGEGQVVRGDRGAASGEEKPHYKLEAWRVAMDLVEETYRATAGFPSHEQFGLTTQMRRAAISISSNIAEGAARESRREFAHFLNIARGSLSELDTQFQIAVRLGYLDEVKQASNLLVRASKLLAGLHKKIKGSLK